MKFLAKLVGALSLIVVAAYLPGVITRVPDVAGFVDREFPRFEIRGGQVVVPTDSTSVVPDHSNRRIVLDVGDGARPGGQGAVNATPASGAEIVIQRDAILVSENVVGSLVGWLFYNHPFEWSQGGGSAAAPRMIAVPVAALPDGVVNSDYCINYLWKMIPFVIFSVVTLGFLFLLLKSHLFAALSSLLEQHLAVRFSYAQLLNLASFSITPAAIIVALYLAMRLEGLNLPMIYLVAYGIFLVGSTNACRPRREEEPVDDTEMF